MSCDDVKKAKAKRNARAEVLRLAGALRECRVELRAQGCVGDFHFGEGQKDPTKADITTRAMSAPSVDAGPSTRPGTAQTARG